MIATHDQILNAENLFQTASRFPDVFRMRRADTHKGSYGTLAVIGGAEGMSGAVVLAAAAAMYQGCGKVWAGFNQSSLPFAVIPERPEIMLATAPDLIRRDGISAWVVGCGLGLDEGARALLEQVLQNTQGSPLLLDADALTLLARSDELKEAARRHGKLIITPHPAEAARLLGVTAADVQGGRVQSVQALSRGYHAVAVLKGRHSLVAAPDGSLYANTSGNAGLATAGSGDVLSGIIGSLLAQGIGIRQAAEAGVWLHGAAADVLRDSEIGEIGMLAGEIAPAARRLRNQIARRLQEANSVHLWQA